MSHIYPVALGLIATWTIVLSSLAPRFASTAVAVTTEHTTAQRSTPTAASDATPPPITLTSHSSSSATDLEYTNVVDHDAKPGEVEPAKATEPTSGAPAVTPPQQQPSIAPAKPSASAPTAAAAPSSSAAASASQPGDAASILKIAVEARVQTLVMCRRGGGPEGPGLAEATYFGDGSYKVLLAAPYGGTPVGECIARRLGSAARTFDGPPIATKIRFEL